MGTSVDAPRARDYYSESAETLQAQIDLAPERFEAESEFRPKYAQLDMEIAGDLLPQILEQYGLVSDVMTEQQSSALLAQREADVSAVEKLGLRATEAFRSANPMQQALIDRINQGALSGLQQGLDPEMIRSVQQGARTAQVSRGLGFGPGEAAIEAMQVGYQGEALRNRNRQYAMQVAGLNQATQADPFMQILGRPSAVTPAMQMAGVGQAGMYNPGAIFNPESAYAQDIYNTNYNAEFNARIANANTKAALIGSLIGGASQVMAAAASPLGGGGGQAGAAVGSAIGCWVAREVYGEANSSWILFRHWLLNDAPSWFRALYLQHGERFADWIRNKSRIKSVIRLWMNTKVRKVPDAIANVRSTEGR